MTSKHQKDYAEAIAEALYDLPQAERLYALAEATKLVMDNIASYEGKSYRLISDWSGFKPRNMHSLYATEARVVRRFVRNITNNNSSEGADAILFKKTDLLDYIGDLPSLARKR